MNIRSGSMLLKAVGGVVALGVAGAGALHLTGGCPLGGCDSGAKSAGKAEQGATVVAVSTTGDEPSHCRMSASACEMAGEVVYTPSATEAAFFEEASSECGDKTTDCEDKSAGCDRPCDMQDEAQDDTVIAENAPAR